MGRRRVWLAGDRTNDCPAVHHEHIYTASGELRLLVKIVLQEPQLAGAMSVFTTYRRPVIREVICKPYSSPAHRPVSSSLPGRRV